MKMSMINVVITAANLTGLIRKARDVCRAVATKGESVFEYAPDGTVQALSGYTPEHAGYFEACIITRIADGYTYKRRAEAAPTPLNHGQCAGLIGKVLLLTGDRHLLCTGVIGSVQNPRLVTTKYEYTPGWLAQKRCKWRYQGLYNPGVTTEHPCWVEAEPAELVEIT